MLGDRFARGQPGRLDADQVDQPGHAMRARVLDHEVGQRLARALQLGAYAGVVGAEVVVLHARHVAAQCSGEGCGFTWIDVVARCGHVLGVGPGAQTAREIERQVDAEPGVRRHRIHEVLDQPAQPGPQREVIALARMQSIPERVDVEARELGDVVRGQACGIDHASAMTSACSPRACGCARADPRACRLHASTTRARSAAAAPCASASCL